MISTNDLRTGVKIEVDGELFAVIEFQHVKPGKGAAFVRTKLRNLRSGGVVERTFRAGEKLPQVRVERREMQYLYSDGDNYVFMDTSSFEQLTLSRETLGDANKYLKDDMMVYVLLHEGETMGVELPNFVDLKVVKADPGLRGDTATGGTKPVTLETGAVVQVPLFIEEGEVLRIDTRTGQYIERV